MQIFDDIKFRDDNTSGYTAGELADLNAELAELIAHLDDEDIEAAYEIAKSFADEVAAR